MPTHLNAYETIDYDATSSVHYELSIVPSSYVARHWHDAVEIISILEGTLLVEVESQRFELSAGHCILLNANVIHSTTSVNGNTSILVQIPLQFLSKYIPDMEQRQFVWNPLTPNAIEQTKIEKVRETLYQMRILDEVKPNGYLLRFHSLLFELLYQLYHNFSFLQTSSSADAQNLKQRKRLTDIFQYTEQNYQRTISLDEIANELHLQVNYFCRFFKAQTGITYLTYLNEYRLSKIYHDLIITDIPLKDLLELHGFTNYKLFRRIFFEHFHMTPRQVRSTYQKH